MLVEGVPLFTAGTRYLQSIDSSGTRITLSGQPLDDASLVAIARSVRPVDAATWQRYEQTGPPSTVRPLPTVSAGTTALPPAGAHRFEGTFHGIEHYTLQTKRCPQVDHNLAETFKLSTGEIWTFQNLYCGTLTDTNLWTGQGTFLFTAPGGTFGGDTYTVARVPTSGGPLPLTISRGTGTYAGAHGSCLLDNHIRQVAFGVLEQSGTFTCAIAYDKPAPNGSPQSP